MMKQLSLIVIGAGRRGIAYCNEMARDRDKFRVVGVADPDPQRRDAVRELFDLPQERCFSSAEEILALPKMADVAIIATQDAQHHAQALRAIELGYHLLLEKPIAQGSKACIDITLAAEKKGVKALVCHVLRYSPFYKAIKNIIMDGTIGTIVSLMAVEALGHEFASNCYVRGPWRSEKESNPKLLAKCCHDLDIIQWLIDKPCKKVSSFGSLTYFTPENAPAGAPKRCLGTDCPAREDCLYSFERIYLAPNSRYAHFNTTLSPREARKITLPKEVVIERMKDTNFASCVYHAGNDVVDHQVVNMEFEGGATASLTMNDFSKSGRYIRIFGTKGELTAYFSNNEIEIFDFDTKETTITPVVKTDQSIFGGHGGGDGGIVLELFDYILGDYHGVCAADIRTSTQNHMIGFAAEQARHQDTVVLLKDYAENFGFDYQ